MKEKIKELLMVILIIFIIFIIFSVAFYCKYVLPYKIIVNGVDSPIKWFLLWLFGGRR